MPCLAVEISGLTVRLSVLFGCPLFSRVRVVVNIGVFGLCHRCQCARSHYFDDWPAFVRCFAEQVLLHWIGMNSLGSTVALPTPSQFLHKEFCRIQWKTIAIQLHSAAFTIFPLLSIRRLWITGHRSFRHSAVATINHMKREKHIAIRKHKSIFGCVRRILPFAFGDLTKILCELFKHKREHNEIIHLNGNEIISSRANGIPFQISDSMHRKSTLISIHSYHALQRKEQICERNDCLNAPNRIPSCT